MSENKKEGRKFKKRKEIIKERRKLKKREEN